jgi:hypothetical protein
MPIGKLVKIGVWEGGKFIGVVVFGRGACPHLHKKHKLRTTEVCELTRVALDTHKTPVSRIISIAMRMLKKKIGSIRLIVSFADTDQGHYGGIYQAGNWVYTGMTSPKNYYINTDGKKVQDRHVTSSGYATAFGGFKKCYAKAQCITVSARGKHRYLMPLDSAMRDQIEPLRKPYPKRTKKHEPAHPVDSGRCDSDPCAPGVANA